MSGLPPGAANAGPGGRLETLFQTFVSAGRRVSIDAERPDVTLVRILRLKRLDARW